MNIVIRGAVDAVTQIKPIRNVLTRLDIDRSEERFRHTIWIDAPYGASIDTCRIYENEYINVRILDKQFKIVSSFQLRSDYFQRLEVV